MSTRPSSNRGPRGGATLLRSLLAFAPLGTAGTGCVRMIPLDTPIVLREAPARQLLIRNELDEPITVRPVIDLAGPAIQVPPAGQASVDFALKEFAKVRKRAAAAGGGYQLGEPIVTVSELPVNVTPYVDLRGTDGVVRIAIGDTEHQFRLRLDDCVWNDPPPGGFILPVIGPPDEGIPVPICDD